ncbi:Uncharacterised protein [Enterobacter kobei]|nr:Uncharacterised protein [Enterobacter kobei]
MNEQELLEAIRCFGRCEVVYLSDGDYVAIPIPENAILVTQDAHEENVAYFRNQER